MSQQYNALSFVTQDYWQYGFASQGVIPMGPYSSLFSDYYGNVASVYLVLRLGNMTDWSGISSAVTTDPTTPGANVFTV